MNILYQEIVTETPLLWIVIGVIGLVLGSVALLCFKDESNTSAIILSILSVGLIITAFVGGANQTKHYVLYGITIDDTTSEKEVLSEYEFIEQKGELYIVREKKEVNK